MVRSKPEFMFELKQNALKLLNKRVDRTVWNHNTLPLPITLDPLECKNFIRHLNGTNNKILNNFNYNGIFTLL